MIYSIGDKVDYTKLHWYSDWDGIDLGYDDINVVGLYHDENSNVDLYIDVETGTILEIFDSNEDEE